MCIIAVSKIGVKQPSLKTLRTMYDNNPDGAGYMYARDGKVFIHKGFMNWKDFERSIKAEKFGKEDPVVYHFRISTQAGVIPTMTHPFPLTENLDLCEKLDLSCSVGIAHNGIIHMTSDKKETRFSDTAFFVTEYMTRLIRNKSDLTDPAVLTMIDNLTNSKWALLNGFTGEISIVGKFINEDGILYSNSTYYPYVGKDNLCGMKTKDWYDWGYQWDSKTNSWVYVGNYCYTDY